MDVAMYSNFAKASGERSEQRVKQLVTTSVERRAKQGEARRSDKNLKKGE